MLKQRALQRSARYVERTLQFDVDFWGTRARDPVIVCPRVPDHVQAHLVRVGPKPHRDKAAIPCPVPLDGVEYPRGVVAQQARRLPLGARLACCIASLFHQRQAGLGRAEAPCVISQRCDTRRGAWPRDGRGGQRKAPSSVHGRGGGGPRRVCAGRSMVSPAQEAELSGPAAREGLCGGAGLRGPAVKVAQRARSEGAGL